MKKLLLVIALVLPLTGCASVQKGFDAISGIVVGINNPVGKNELYALENSMIVAFAGLNAYKRSCVAGALPSNCRAVVVKLQTYTRRLPSALAELRAFVKNNDQVNALTAYNTVRALLDSFKAEAAVAGVKVS